jgi:hypothetical protein
MAVHDPPRPQGPRWWDKQGLWGGLFAGVGFALVELVVMGAQEGTVAVARLLRRVAATWIGPEALDPAYPFGIVAVVGTVLHLGLSALFGLIFVWLTEAIGAPLFRSRALMLAAAIAYGVLLWPINVYLIAPFVGWEWFAGETEPAVQAAAHFCYGLLLGIYLDRRVAAWRARRIRVWRRDDALAASPTGATEPAP